jgi:2,3-bisphosphoglycerate-independent phosphoglycerate mutase
MSPRPRPLALIILDGWGYREEKKANAIAAAHKPHWDYLWERYPHALISGSGRCVGLPEGQMGNSEVGHLNMGAGRVVHQDFTRIDLAIDDGEFAANPTLLNTINATVKSNHALHIMGLLSPGGVHSHEKQIFALLEMAANHGVKKVYLHTFLDGRDTPPRSAKESLQKLNALCKKLHCGKIASIIGRYYAMDRDKRWERVQKAYDLLSMGLAEFHSVDPILALEAAYTRGENDEFMQATSIHNEDAAPVVMADGDAIIFMNFRADRARELTQAFIDKDFSGFQRKVVPQLDAFVTLTEYAAAFKVPAAFPPQPLTHILGEYLSELGLRQLRIAETEKYAHVTFFLNCCV